MAELDKICVRHFEEIGIELLYSNLPIEMFDFHIQNNNSEQEADWQKNFGMPLYSFNARNPNRQDR
jgi:hypothetical protein